MNTMRCLLCCLVVVASSAAASAADEASVRQWHTQTLSFAGPDSSETADPNPFTDYCLWVRFIHPDVSYTVRGFYAADGNAAETSASSGNIWQVRFSPDLGGTWRYEAVLRHGRDVAIMDDPHAGESVALESASGSFEVAANPSTSRDFRHRGRLIADGGYLRFMNSNERLLKCGTNSPENLLAYADFDGTRRISTETTSGEAQASDELHHYTAHVKDWNEGDPAWQNGKGKGLIGGINYLASTGMNVMYFLTLNIEGDGKDVWPYLTPDEFTRFDCSKLDQWEIVFQHMQSRGIVMHVVTQETENERLLDDGDVGRTRQLYYRELIARFAHHPALIWNLGEENGPADFSPNGQTPEQQRAMATFFRQNDPYRHPVVIHTHASVQGKEEILPHLLGHSPLDGLSFQVSPPESVHEEITQWRHEAIAAGHPWMIGMDEIGMWHTGLVPDAEDPDHDLLRRHVLWGGLMAGACGVEWYFGAHHPHNDLTSEDWRQRANMWNQTRHALRFFEEHLPYWEMSPVGNITDCDAAFCFAKSGEVYSLYLPATADAPAPSTTVNLRDESGTFDVLWFDPVNGGALRKSVPAQLSGGTDVTLRWPDAAPNHDWVVLLSRRK